MYMLFNMKLTCLLGKTMQRALATTLAITSFCAVDARVSTPD